MLKTLMQTQEHMHTADYFIYSMPQILPISWATLIVKRLKKRSRTVLDIG